MYIITICCPSGLIQDSEELKRRSILLVFFMCLVKRYYVLSAWLSLLTSFLSSTTIFASSNSWLRVPFSFKSLCLNAWNLNIILKESFYFQNKVTVKEVKFKKEYLNDEDVFLIDLGLQIFQVHFYCQTKRLFTWENSHRHEFSYWDDFFISYRVYIMTGSLHILKFEGTLHVDKIHMWFKITNITHGYLFQSTGRPISQHNG